MKETEKNTDTHTHTYTHAGGAKRRSNVGRERDDVRPRERTTAKNITFPRTDLTRLNRDGPRNSPLPGEAFFGLADAVPLRSIGPSACFRFSRSFLIPLSSLTFYPPLCCPARTPSIDITFSLSPNKPLGSPFFLRTLYFACLLSLALFKHILAPPLFLSLWHPFIVIFPPPSILSLSPYGWFFLILQL